MATGSLSSYCVEEFALLLEEEDFPQDVIEAVIKNEIDGEIFMDLSEDYLKEIAPRLKDRVLLKRLQSANSSSTHPAPQLQEKVTNSSIQSIAMH